MQDGRGFLCCHTLCIFHSCSAMWLCHTICWSDTSWPYADEADPTTAHSKVLMHQMENKYAPTVFNETRPYLYPAARAQQNVRAQCRWLSPHMHAHSPTHQVSVPCGGHTRTRWPLLHQLMVDGWDTKGGVRGDTFRISNAWVIFIYLHVCVWYE